MMGICSSYRKLNWIWCKDSGTNGSTCESKKKTDETASKESPADTNAAETKVAHAVVLAERTVAPSQPAKVVRELNAEQEVQKKEKKFEATANSIEKYYCRANQELQAELNIEWAHLRQGRRAELAAGSAVAGARRQ